MTFGPGPSPDAPLGAGGQSPDALGAGGQGQREARQAVSIPPIAGQAVVRQSVPPLRGAITIEQQREAVREFLAKALIWVVVGTVLLGGGLIASAHYLHLSADNVLSFFAPIFSGVIALAGSAIGFYFGSEHAARSSSFSESDT